MLYWGNIGAGILFFCKDQILLTLRSQHMIEPGTWCAPGGSIHGEKYLHSETMKHLQIPEEKIWEGAQQEIKEELGSIPKNIKPFDKVVYRDKGFEYTTFFVEIPEIVKDSWKFDIDKFEVEDINWFSKDKLPTPLHFGLIYIMQQRPQYPIA